MIRALLVALLLAWPALAAEDFTQRSTCLGHWGAFTDGQMASAEDDNCDAGGQDGENPINWLAGVEIEHGEAPPLAPAGSDSTYHFAYPPFGEITDSQHWAFPDFTYVGWHNREESALIGLVMHYKTATNYSGAYSLRCTAGDKLKGKVSSTVSGDGSDGTCALDTWILLGLRYDGSVNDEVAVFTSESTKPNTLKDCGDDPCATEATGPIDYNDNVELLMDQSAGKEFNGWVQETAYFDEALSDEEICQFCRCGGQSDVRGVGRVDECNRCIVPDYEGCRRVID